MKISRQLLADYFAEGLLNESTGVLTRRTGEALGLNRGLAGGTDNDLDDSQATPPAT